MKARSTKQELRDAFLRGVKIAMLCHDYEHNMEIACHNCGRILELDEIDERGAIEQGLEALDLSHFKPRSQGHGYDERKWPDVGVDHPGNLLLECRKCHNKRHPGPWPDEEIPAGPGLG